MSVVKNTEKLLIKISESVRKTLVLYSEIRNIKKKSHLWSTVTLTPQQERKIQLFFKDNYGKKISSKWHRLYQSYTDTFRYNYFPEYIFSTELEPKTNPYRVAELLGDKNFLSVFFSNISEVSVPQNVFYAVNGTIYNTDRNIITLQEAVKLLLVSKDCLVIKKTIDTSSGRDVAILNGNYSYEEAESLIKRFGKDFVVQDFIRQSQELLALNSSSVNTFRVITYICDDDIFTCPVALRMGRANADKDNIHNGGISVGVQEDGYLKKYAFSEYGEVFTEHPDSKVQFSGYYIPEAGTKLRSVAKKLHSYVPWLGIISWDLTINEQGDITLVEMNTTGQSAWFCQMVNGEPLFGNNTSKMLEMIK